MGAGHRNILIAGAGTTGLAAAIELARRGFRPRIIDSDVGPVPLSESRALGINARTLTLLSPSRAADAIQQEAYRIDRFRVRSGKKVLLRSILPKSTAAFRQSRCLRRAIRNG